MMDEEDGGNQSEDERKIYTLKCLQKMKEKGSRFWSVILNSLVPASLVNIVLAS
jgi:hypothetical protein